MVTSPFRRHQQHVRGIMSGAHVRNASRVAEMPNDTPAGQEYAALRVLLHDNLRVLSDIASIEARNPRKREYAAAFSDWIEGALLAGEQGKASQDEILITNMIWALDYRDYDYALRLAAHAIRFDLAMPQRFRSQPTGFLAETIADTSLAQKDSVSHEQLLATLQLIEGADMLDLVKARLHKAIGRSWERKAEAFDPTADTAPAGGKAAFLTEALNHTNRAYELDHNVGVKDDIKRLDRHLARLAREAEGIADPGTPPAPPLETPMPPAKPPRAPVQKRAQRPPPKPARKPKAPPAT